MAERNSSSWRKSLGIDVLSAARQRIAWVFDSCPRVYVSFSGGKDSTVMLHLVMDEAIRRSRKVGLLFVDLEAQYRLTIEHVRECFRLYADHLEPFWLALPLNLRNAVSQIEPQWMCWDETKRDAWVREMPPEAEPRSRFPWFWERMEFEELVPAFGEWYSQGEPTACFVGIRTDESLNRWRTIVQSKKQCMDGRRWTTWCGGAVWNMYPIYDWRTEDLWTYHARYPAMPYNRLYDRMHQAGLTIHQARICQPYGDDQRKGLWLFHIIEPETWARVLARVAGANHGALYVQESSGSILGYRNITKPPSITWKEFAALLLDSMPSATADHYRNKLAMFVARWRKRGRELDDEGPITKTGGDGHPNWKRVCKALLRNDYWCKGLAFSPTGSASYDRYKKLMKRRRSEWGDEI